MKGIAGVLALGVVMLLLAPHVSLAELGWCGNAYPCSGSTHSSSSDIAVYFQAWKDGVTNQVGRGAGISAKLFYRKSSAASYDSVAMPFFGDKDVSNDEYSAPIPSSALTPGVQILYYCTFYDSTDGTICTGQDQGTCPGGSHAPPFTLNIASGTTRDVTVTFTFCQPAADPDPGNVCVTGSNAAITTWGSGVQMTKLACDLSEPRNHHYTLDVLFLTGSNPSVEYKYKRDGCSTWQPDPNKTFIINDSSATQILPADGWGSNPASCCTVGTENWTWGTIKAIYR